MKNADRTELGLAVATTENADTTELRLAKVPTQAVRIILRISIAVVVLTLLVLVVSPRTLAPYDPFEINATERLQSPSLSHPFGTDRIGRDVLSRVIVGAKPSILVSMGIVVLSLSGGLLFGVLAGFVERLDNVIMRIMDGLMAFPFILLAMVVLAVLGRTIPNIVLAVSVVYTPMIARVVRSSVLTMREVGFVEASIACGASDLRVIVRHILPNVLPILIVQASYFGARALLTEASLSFLGLGLSPDMPSWGVLLGEGRTFMRDAPWATIAPGLAIALTVLALNVLGDVVRDHLDPHLIRSGKN